MKLCVIDNTALRSSNYGSKAQYGVSSSLGTYKGYKIYLVASADNIYIPIAFMVTTAEVYDNQISDILYDVNTFNLFLFLADAAYDNTEWFKKTKSLGINLLTDVNMRRANSIELENPRLYGKQRYTRHIQWVLFAYLLDEYIKKQEGIKSRKYPWNQ